VEKNILLRLYICVKTRHQLSEVLLVCFLPISSKQIKNKSSLNGSKVAGALPAVELTTNTRLTASELCGINDTS